MRRRLLPYSVRLDSLWAGVYSLLVPTKLTTGSIKNMFRPWFEENQTEVCALLGLEPDRTAAAEDGEAEDRGFTLEDALNPKNWARDEKRQFKSQYGTKDDPDGVANLHKDAGDSWSLALQEAHFNDELTSQVVESGDFGKCVVRFFYNKKLQKVDETLILEVVTTPDDTQVIYWALSG